MFFIEDSRLNERGERSWRNDHKNIVLFGISLLVVVASFLPMLLRNHYSTDSYHLISDQHTLWYLQCGRYTFWAFSLIFEHLGINLVLAQRWFIAFCLLCLAGCNVAFVRLFERLSGLEGGIREGAFLLMLASLMWCNVCTEDWILFPEAAGTIALAAVLVTASIVFFFLGDSRRALVLSALFLLAALGSYQSMVGSYIAATVLVGHLKYRNDLHAKLISDIKGIVIGGICAVLNIAILKVLIVSGFFGESGRGSTFDISVIISNLLKVAQYQIAFWGNLDGLMPCPVMQLLEVALVSLFFFAFRRDCKAGLSYLFSFVIALGAAYAPHYVEATILLSPRSNIAVWTAISCIFVVLLCDRLEERRIRSVSVYALTKDESSRGKTAFLPVCSLAAFVLLSFAFMWDIAYDVYTSNVQDRAYAESVAVAIRNYEEISGIAVRSLGVVGDASVERSYPETRYSCHELGNRIMNVPYSRVEMINYLSGLDLQQIEISEAKAKDLFGDEDWDHEDLKEQLKFDGDIAYLAVY